MNLEIFRIKDLLFEEMELALTTTCSLLSLIKEDQWEYRPNENMRSLIELARHLVHVPAQELAILQEQSMEQVRSLVISVMHLKDAAALSDVMHRGVAALKDYMNSLDETELLYKSTAPFFAKHQPAVQFKWLMEITTHLYHHRGQMFTYMKQLDLPVSMRDLYGPVSDSWTL
ncbi:DinB family protein [Paenibacillus sedimenti]|uniref:DinB family protein n=1 Tax=Paenibacillus sedimenti TaxID=2770274 RepID=A0A926KS83_9BACL|nr:DinB family protein [Paenibacillus sedimenti]MBD0382582.1 DinB family protein [Paenibacillus sedimenti]